MHFDDNEILGAIFGDGWVFESMTSNLSTALLMEVCASMAYPCLKTGSFSNFLGSVNRMILLDEFPPGCI